jgi:ankyrin repeat protein
MAQDRGYDEIAIFLRDALARPELARRWVETGDIDYGQDDDQKYFDKAIHEDKLQEVQALLTNRPELARNEMSSWAEGVLMMPARSGNRPMLELLIRFGAEVPAVTKWGRSYYFAHEDVAAFLLNSGMSPRHVNWHEVTLLHDMAQIGDIPKARLLLDHGADINAIDEEYRSTPLGLAARWGQSKMVAFLLERGADPNRAGAAWSTPLSWAQKKGHVSIANDLVAVGATNN